MPAGNRELASVGGCCDGIDDEKADGMTRGDFGDVEDSCDNSMVDNGCGKRR